MAVLMLLVFFLLVTGAIAGALTHRRPERPTMELPEEPVLDLRLPDRSPEIQSDEEPRTFLS